MKPEIYKALKDRLAIVPIGNGLTAWKFYTVGLNDGIDFYSPDYIDPVVFHAKSIWNAAQRIYSILNEQYLNIDERLLNGNEEADLYPNGYGIRNFVSTYLEGDSDSAIAQLENIGGVYEKEFQEITGTTVGAMLKHWRSFHKVIDVLKKRYSL